MGPALSVLHEGSCSANKNRGTGADAPKPKLDKAMSLTISLHESDFGISPAQNPKFLGDWPKEDLLKGLQESGILKKLAARGFSDLQLDMDTSDFFVHRLTLTDGSVKHNRAPDSFLAQLFVRRRSLDLDDLIIESTRSKTFAGLVGDKLKAQEKEWMRQTAPSHTEASILEFLRLQDPRRSFEEGGSERGPLPGQLHPGLGIAREINAMVKEGARRRGRDLLVNRPDYFHNAVMYSQEYVFVSPIFQGCFDVMTSDLSADLKQKGLGALSWAVHSKALSVVTDRRGGGGEAELEGKEKGRESPSHPSSPSTAAIPFYWDPPLQVLPISSGWQQYFSSEGYARLRAEARASVQSLVERLQREGVGTSRAFSIDWDSEAGAAALRFSSPGALERVGTNIKLSHSVLGQSVHEK
uniref:Uncharacterized protein n=1 Tax=Chromera velia CCMP2878 TaxID=1169474 RepID=A0A0G4ICJ8_9ALVE|eukprot:Cvel_13063.t1-p1 / transcript=Cvel_13063.t1 / gene=Cvel_13063 / organism=Chromera_velia_CCMP2878 / gene_product=hypothetical protein / transcript_product=hypothetical protein / location=Cvel_scaffold879:18590-22421(-) / protein_length=411 / sequence_SO=supercontig / SO=protein_coding / is_pseudo=false